MARGRIWGLLVAALGLALAPQAVRAQAFNDWAVVVISGDYHAQGNLETDAFDNARTDVVAALVSRGFSAGNIRQFSARPEHYQDPNVGGPDWEGIIGSLSEVSQTARGGCLVYMSSHGAPQGFLLGRQILPPAVLANAVGGVCQQRPTVLVVSACFSGVFVPAMAGDNRMILTAARPDRSSFGCGVSNRYPYFDDCFLQVLPQSSDFVDLGPRVQACVADMELAQGMRPPSEPQVWIDPAFRPALARRRFTAGAGVRPVRGPPARPATPPVTAGVSKRAH